MVRSCRQIPRLSGVAICVLGLAGCSDGKSPSSPSPPSNSGPATLFRGQIAAGATGVSGMPAMAASVDGTLLGALDDGAVLRLASGESLRVFVAADGRPERAVIGDAVFVFTNIGEAAVSVTAMSRDGRRIALGAIPISSEWAGGWRKNSTRRSVRSVQAVELTLSAKLKYAALAVESVGCLVAAVKGLLGAIETFGLSLAVSALGCASTLVDAAVVFGLEDDPELASSRNAAGNIASAIGCATQTNPFDCLALALKAIANQLESFEAAQRELVDQFSINGSVIDKATRQTIAGAPIDVFIDGQPVTDRGTTTDRAGQFTVSSLPPNILVTLKVSRTAGYIPVSVEVQVGTGTHTEIVLQRLGDSSMWGYVLYEHPITGALVTITDGPAAGRRAVTDAEGMFLFDDLPNGLMTFEAWVSGYKPNARQYEMRTGANRMDFFMSRTGTWIGNTDNTSP